jgi:hypothetical protein
MIGGEPKGEVAVEAVQQTAQVASAGIEIDGRVGRFGHAVDRRSIGQSLHEPDHAGRRDNFSTISAFSFTDDMRQFGIQSVLRHGGLDYPHIGGPVPFDPFAVAEVVRTLLICSDS